MDVKVFAIIVTFNGMNWVDRCLSSLQESHFVKVIVIDNNSGDGICEHIKTHFPSVDVIKSNVNLGFAKANNIGIRKALEAGAEYIFLLNQDAWVNEGAIEKLVNTFTEGHDIGIVSPIHMNGANTGLDWGFAGYVPEDFVSDSYQGKLKPTYDAEFINAAAWMISRDCIEKVGGFDSSLFVHYGEDRNFNQRRIYHGFKMILRTDCSICHDREFRKGHEEEYRNSIFAQTDVNRRIEYGNILVDIDIDGFIRQNRKSLIKSYIKLKFSQADKLKREISFLETVKESRNRNRKGGPNWL